MDILQNLQSLLGGALSGGSGQGGRAQSGMGAQSGGLGELLSPDVLGGIANALFANKRGARSMGSTAGGSAGGGLGDMLGALLSGDGADLLGRLAGGLTGGSAGAGGSMLGAAASAPSPAAATGDPSGRAGRMIRALVFAAKADGHIDANEERVINDQMRELNVGAEGQAFLRDAMQEPLDPERVARGVADDREALEIYALSCAITDRDHFMEREYLNNLAKALRIDPKAQSAIEARFSAT